MLLNLGRKDANAGHLRGPASLTCASLAVAEGTIQETHLMNLEIRLEDLVEWFVKTNAKSAHAFRDAAAVLPGGNTRTVLHQTPFPMVIKSGDGPNVTSIDGSEYTDFVSEYSAAMYGHSHPKIHKAVQEALSIGMNLGGVIGKEAEFGRVIQERFPAMELLRFTNSGTEANTLALAAALTYSGKKEVLVFENGYHGSTLSFPGGISSALNLPHQFLIAKYNDIERTRQLLHNSIGVILVEPLQSAGGVIPATLEFLQFLRNAATDLGAVLIFDEIVTSRLDYHGMQGYWGIKPDMTTLGKYMGGGFSFGCFGGQKEIMDQFDPTASSHFAHSGTYNKNVFTMVAGIAGSKLVTRCEISRINALGDRLRLTINQMGLINGTYLVKAVGFGSAVGLHFRNSASDMLRDFFYFGLLRKGILIARRGFIMINLMHTDHHVDAFLEAFLEVLHSLL